MSNPPLLHHPEIPYQQVFHSSLELNNIKLLVKRLDKIHPLVSGNKFFKLKYNIEAAKKAGYTRLLTFGGAFSNHIHACAEAARIENMELIGVIRGEETFPINPTLEKARKSGMKIHYVSRFLYKNKKDPQFLKSLKDHYGDFYLIPEGGTNHLAIKGTREILESEDLKADIIACSIGTGGTIAGLLASANENQQLWGFSSLKGAFIHKDLEDLMTAHSIKPKCSYKIDTDYHFGGYGKHKKELLEFMQSFYNSTGIPLDPIYTGKMMYGIFDNLDNIPENTTILCIHTGGLQGIAGFNQRFGTALPEK